MLKPLSIHLIAGEEMPGKSLGYFDLHCPSRCAILEKLPRPVGSRAQTAQPLLRAFQGASAIKADPVPYWPQKCPQYASPQTGLTAMNIILRRVYAHDAELAGIRVLVDRLWPRGISKSAALWDVWLKDIAPSNNLRKWFAHDETKWPEFKERYFAELDAAPAAVAQLQTILRQNPIVILLYAAKATEMNNAVALREYVGGMARENTDATRQPD